MSRIQSKKQQGRHRAFVRYVRDLLPTACPVITETEISRYLGKHMDVQRAADAFVDNFKQKANAIP